MFVYTVLAGAYSFVNRIKQFEPTVRRSYKLWCHNTERWSLMKLILTMSLCTNLHINNIYNSSVGCKDCCSRASSLVSCDKKIPRYGEYLLPFKKETLNINNYLVINWPYHLTVDQNTHTHDGSACVSTGLCNTVRDSTLQCQSILCPSQRIGNGVSVTITPAPLSSCFSTAKHVRMYNRGTMSSNVNLSLLWFCVWLIFHGFV